jgi:lipoyl(octanoyl) transferase
MSCNVYWLGTVEYSKAWQLQKQLLDQRASGSIRDTILFLEHFPVITLGKSGKLDNVLIPREKLDENNISFFLSDRGGDATFHGPGQLICYLILALREEHKSIHQHIYDLEEIIIRTLKHFSIDAGRDENHPGAWVSNEEIAAIGLGVKKGVSMHGFGLNVNINLDYFNLIRPCGFSDRKVTSMSAILTRDISVESVLDIMPKYVSQVLDIPVEWKPVSDLKAFL